MNLLQMLIEAGPALGSVDDEGHSLVCKALRCTADEILLEELFNKGYALTSCRRHESALYCALNRDPDVLLRVDVVKFLYQNGVDLGEPDRDGVSPLHRALRFGVYETAAIEFLRSHARIYTNYSFGAWDLTPLHCAVLNPHCQDSAVEFLIRQGASTDAENSARSTPLHLAVSQPFCRSSIVKLLVKKNHSKNDRNMSGDTPLKACLKVHHDFEIANVLLAADCFLEPKSSHQSCYFIDLAISNADFLKFQSQQKVDYFRRLTKYAMFIKPDCISEGAINAPVQNRALADYAKRCREELKVMMSLDFGKKGTFYEFLRKRVPIYDVSEKPPAPFDLDDLMDILSWNSFPIYQDVIAAKVGTDSSLDGMTESIIYAIKSGCRSPQPER